MDITGSEAGGAALYQEAANAFIRFCPHDREIGNPAVGDPHFRAVQDVGVALTTRRGAHAAGVTAGIRLGQPEAANDFAACHTRQPTLFLLF